MTAFFSSLRLPGLAVAGLILAGCSVPDTPTDIHDPYEPVNRAVHSFNKGVDTVAIRPASQVYGHIVPQPVRTGLDNVASNLGLPAAVANKSLQGEPEDAVHNLFRFLVNSTLGVFGIFDAAASFGLEERSADFGQTLGVWGTPEGAYLELPLLGPSTERAAVGQVVDIALNPLSLFSDDVREAEVAGTGTSLLNYRYTFSTTVDGILYESADSYAQLRLFYLDSSRFAEGGETADAIDTELYDDLYGDLYDQ